MKTRLLSLALIAGLVAVPGLQADKFGWFNLSPSQLAYTGLSVAGEAVKTGAQKAYNKISPTISKLAKNYREHFFANPTTTGTCSAIGALALGASACILGPTIIDITKNSITGAPRLLSKLVWEGLKGATPIIKSATRSISAPSQCTKLGLTLGTIAGLMGFSVLHEPTFINPEDYSSDRTTVYAAKRNVEQVLRSNYQVLRSNYQDGEQS